MPRMDGTGPAGQGPRTGRGLGPCGTGTNPQNTGAQQPASQSTGWVSTALGILAALGFGASGGSRGTGRGQGRGRGRGRA